MKAIPDEQNEKAEEREDVLPPSWKEVESIGQKEMEKSICEPSGSVGWLADWNDCTPGDKQNDGDGDTLMVDICSIFSAPCFNLFSIFFLNCKYFLNIKVIITILK